MATCDQCGRWKHDDNHCVFCAKQHKELIEAVRRYRDEVEAAEIMYGFTIDSAEINRFID